MREVTVSMFGEDGEEHSVAVEADSLFHACEKAIQNSVRLWWFDPEAVLVVRSGADRLRVRQEALRLARKTR